MERARRKSTDTSPCSPREQGARNELLEIVVESNRPTDSIAGGSPGSSVNNDAEKHRRRVAFYNRQDRKSSSAKTPVHSISPYSLPPASHIGMLEISSDFVGTLRRNFFSKRDRNKDPTPHDEALMSISKLSDMRAHSSSKLVGAKSYHTEFKIFQDTIDFRQDSMGGEGVHYIAASKKAGSGYWMASILAIRGRAFAFWPMTVYTCYTVMAVCLLQWHIDANPAAATQPSGNAISSGGSINGSQSTTQIIQGLQSAVVLISTALFFLQTFRTNHAYNRWWEGRCLWANVTAHILTISRTVAGGSIKSQQLGRRMLRWGAVFLVSLKASLRGEDDMEELENLLTVREVSSLELKHIDFRPLFCLQQIQQAWGESQDDKFIRECASKEMEKVMPELSTGMMGLKRIQGTSMPFGYVSHLRSFLVIWLCLLPYVFVYQMKYYSIGICIIIAYSLLGMEVLSLELEYPFGREFNHLPMDSMTKQTLSELFESYATTVNLPRTKLSGGSTPDEEEEPAIYSSMHRSTRTTATDTRMINNLPGNLHTVAENCRDSSQPPMFGKLSSGSGHGSIKPQDNSVHNPSNGSSKHTPPTALGLQPQPWPQMARVSTPEGQVTGSPDQDPDPKRPLSNPHPPSLDLK